MDIIGSSDDDFLIIKRGVTWAAGKTGDDHFILESTKDLKVDGGFGRDTFEFQIFEGQTFTTNEIHDDKTVIKVFEDGERIQKIVLFDVEQIDWFMVG